MASLITENDYFAVKLFDAERWNRPIAAFHFCAFPPNETPGVSSDLAPVNHWAIYLQSAAKESELVDMVPGFGADNRDGRVTVISKHSDKPEDAVKILSDWALDVARANDGGNRGRCSDTLRRPRF